jgi:hypothetical protein
VIFEFMIVSLSTVEVPESLHPLPMPGQSEELLAVIFPAKIVRFPTIERPW